MRTVLAARSVIHEAVSAVAYDIVISGLVSPRLSALCGLYVSCNFFPFCVPIVGVLDDDNIIVKCQYSEDLCHVTCKPFRKDIRKYYSAPCSYMYFPDWLMREVFAVLTFLDQPVSMGQHTIILPHDTTHTCVCDLC